MGKKYEAAKGVDLAVPSPLRRLQLHACNGSANGVL